MENHAECFCRSDENHREIGCFFKYAIFLLKRFVSSLDLLAMDPKDARNDVLKNDIWIRIATQYDGYYTGKILLLDATHIEFTLKIDLTKCVNFL